MEPPGAARIVFDAAICVGRGGGGLRPGDPFVLTLEARHQPDRHWRKLMVKHRCQQAESKDVFYSPTVPDRQDGTLREFGRQAWAAFRLPR